MWKKGEAEVVKLSILSKYPPCPGIESPISFTPKSLFIADTIASPIKPNNATEKLNNTICQNSSNGVKKPM